MKKPTIEELMSEMDHEVVVVKNSRHPSDHTEAMLVTHPEYTYVFVWRRTANGPRSRMSVHANSNIFTGFQMTSTSDFVGEYGELLQATLDDILCYDTQTSKFTVSFGQVGMKRAVARWIKNKLHSEQ